MNYIIVKRENGGCNIVIPAPEMFDPNSRTRTLVPELNNATDDDIYLFIINSNGLQEGTYKIVDETTIPNYGLFRDAWIINDINTGIEFDIQKCTEIKLNQFRELRKPFLETLDVAYMKARELNEDVTSIIAQKQALRDVTLVVLPTDINELESFIPDILKESE